MSSRWISTSLSPADLAMHGLDERALAHAARAPQQRVVGGQAAGEALRIGKQGIAHPVDALQQRKRHAVDLDDGEEGFGLGLPDEGIGRPESRASRPRVGPSRSSARAIRSISQRSAPESSWSTPVAKALIGRYSRATFAI